MLILEIAASIVLAAFILRYLDLAIVATSFLFAAAVGLAVSAIVIAWMAFCPRKIFAA